MDTEIDADEALERYRQAMIRQAAAQRDKSAASDARALAVLALLESGLSQHEIGRRLGITYQRAQQLVRQGRRARDAAVPPF